MSAPAAAAKIAAMAPAAPAPMTTTPHRLLSLVNRHACLSRCTGANRQSRTRHVQADDGHGIDLRRERHDITDRPIQPGEEHRLARSSTGATGIWALLRKTFSSASDRSQA